MNPASERRDFLGASDAAAVCGLSKYRQPLDVYLEKRGLVEPRVETDAMRLGKKLESVIISEYQERTGNLVTSPCETVCHPDFDYIRATPDGLVDEDTLLECKTAGWRMKQDWGDEGSDWIPDDYLAQVQQQMAVTGKKSCDVAVLFGGQELKLYRVERNEAVIAHILARCQTLWELIQRGEPPPPDWNHKSSLELLQRALAPGEGQGEVQLDQERLADWQEYQECCKVAGQMAAAKVLCRLRIMSAMGEAQRGLFPNGTAVRKSLVRSAGYSVAAREYVILKQEQTHRNQRSP